MAEKNPETRTKQRVIAVGYEINFESVLDLLEQHRPGIKDTMSSLKVHSGVFYSTSCRGMDPEDMKSEPDLSTWFKARVGKVIHGKLIKLHISRKGDLVVGELQSGRDLIYTFILNTDNKSTSLQKKLVYKKDPMFSTVTIPETKVPCRPYIHIEKISQRKTLSENIYPPGTESWGWDQIDKTNITVYE